MNRNQKELRRAAAEAFMASLDQLDNVFDSNNEGSSRSGPPAKSNAGKQQRSTNSNREEQPSADEGLEAGE